MVCFLLNQIMNLETLVVNLVIFPIIIVKIYVPMKNCLPFTVSYDYIWLNEIIRGCSCSKYFFFDYLCWNLSQLKSLLADSERAKLIKKLSQANQQNRFLKRQVCTYAVVYFFPPILTFYLGAIFIIFKGIWLSHAPS